MTEGPNKARGANAAQSKRLGEHDPSRGNLKPRRQEVKELSTMIRLSLASFAVMSLPLAAIPALSSAGIPALDYAVAVLFWLGLIGGIVFFAVSRLIVLSGARLERIRESTRSLPGVISFSLKPGHLILYIVFLLAAGVCVADAVTGGLPPWLVFPAIAAAAFTFSAHCVIDGVYYKVYKLAKEGIDYEHKSR